MEQNLVNEKKLLGLLNMHPPFSPRACMGSSWHAIGVDELEWLKSPEGVVAIEQLIQNMCTNWGAIEDIEEV
jgi:hypothetical protein